MKSLKLSGISVNTILFFLLKIWIGTNIISAFFYILINDYNVNEVNGVLIYTKLLFTKEFWQAILLVIFYGLIFSSPTMLFLGFIIKLLTNNKLILVFVSVILVFASFYLTGFMALKNSLFYILYPPIIYSVVISSLILIINIGKKEKLI